MIHGFEPWFYKPAKWVFTILLTIFIIAVSVLVALVTMSLQADTGDPTITSRIKYLRLALAWILITAWFIPNFVLAPLPLQSPSALHKMTKILSVITEAMPLVILVINLCNLIAEQKSGMAQLALVLQNGDLMSIINDS